MKRRFGCEQLESRRVLATIDLAALAATEGMTLYGATPAEQSGFSVSDAGDVNGDGFDDMIVSSKIQTRPGFFFPGASYLVYGAATMPASIDLATIGSAGVTFQGVKSSAEFGYSVSSAGDLNADGFDDLVMGAPYASGATNTKPLSGETYVFFGSASLPSVMTVASANMIIFGADTNDRSGFSVSGAGDVNGDGYDDMVIGAFVADSLSNARMDAGESYVIFGGASLPATIDLGTLGTAGVTVYGRAFGDQTGLSVSGAGDVNGDGFADVIISAANAANVSPLRSENGRSYVVFGGVALPMTIDLATPASTFITIIGAETGDSSGYTVSGGGDVNGDGLDDLLINSPNADGPGVFTRNRSGDSYVVYGSTTLPTEIDLLTLGTAGVTIIGAEALDSGVDFISGGWIGDAGDVNADGYDDLIIGKERADAAGNAKPQAGDSIVVFGGPSLPSTIDLLTPGSAGIEIFGADSADNNGISVSSAGDVNGDGFADLLTGAAFADGATNSAPNTGESYLIYGGNGFTSSVTHPGTASPETLTGTVGIDVMVGGRGNDILLGNGAADVMSGGEGDDILAIGNLPFNRAAGGNGDDTLRFDGSGMNLDLTTFGNSRALGIEQIDITGIGVNTLTLNLLEVLNISDESNQLIVRRNGGDVVNIGSGWTQGADQLIGSDNFQTYTQGLATLLIEDPTPLGTTGDDAFVFTYLSNTNTGNFSITRSTNAGPVEDLGVFPMNVALTLDALGGTDSARIEGTTNADTFVVTSAGLTINGHSLNILGFETRTLAANDGDDIHQFDSDAALGSWILDESVGGIDTLDFASTTSQAVALNLSLATAQVINANLSLTLGSNIHFENAIGGSQGDTLTGNANANSLTGGPGGDSLNGLAGNDNLSGGTGDDTYAFDTPAGAEADIVNEATNQGTDTLSFAAMSTAVSLNLGLIVVQPVHTNRTLKLNSKTAFENIIGGSGPDTLIGNTANNVLTGGDGNDSLSGAAGNDTLIGGLNDDTYIYGTATAAESDLVQEQPGEGTDTLTFSTLQTAIGLDLASIAVQPVHANRTLQLNSATAFENAIGGKGGDTLTGNTLDNLLNGGAGLDTLNGSDGSDTLIGGLQNDTYIFSPATSFEADEVQEAANQGLDTLSFASLATSVTLNLGSLAVQPIHANRTLKLNAQTTFENIIGGSAADTLTGNLLNNSLTGNAGNDVFVGGAGNDTLFGGLDDDTYIFAPATTAESDFLIEVANQGTDTISFASVATGVTLNLASSLDQAVHTNRMLRLNSGGSFENTIGGTGNDVFQGNNLNNSLAGGNGNNILVGSGGADVLTGGTGRDILIGGLGLDTLGGGSGEDTLIAGRTLSDTNVANLLTIQTEWVSANSYATRITNLKAGLLTPLSDVLNDAGDDDVLTGGANSDWYFAAVDDVITDLFGGEIVDSL